MANTHDLQSIKKETGLSQSFLRRLIEKAPSLKEKYAKRGDKNKLLYGSNGFQVFISALRMKEEGRTLTEIAETIEKSAEVNNSKQLIKQEETNAKQNGTEEGKELFSKYFEQFAQVSRDYQETLKQLTEEKTGRMEAESQILLLTDGRSYKEVQEERKQELEEQARIKIKLEETTSSLKQIKLEQQNTQEQLSKQEQEIKIREKIDKLWHEHRSFGFFQGKEKKRVLAKVKELEDTIIQQKKGNLHQTSTSNL